MDYGVKGAGSSIQLIREVGAPLEAIGMNLPEDYPKGGKFKWMVVDACWEFPNASTACGPLNKALFANAAGKSKLGPWEAGSRIFNAALRHGNHPNISYQRGGWVDCASALAAVRDGLSKKYDMKTVVRIASVRWLFGMMFDKDKTLKSRFQLAGVVDGNGTLVEICYVRCKSGHSEQVAKLIPNGTIYTKITSEHLNYISCLATRLGSRTLRISARWVSFPVGSGVATTALTPTSHPSHRLTIGILLRVGLRVSTTW